ncbi:MAG: DUF4097 domain-containing protein [Acetatifactor sp.]|nr:DUF4097 domain-containing protein [Acetatifactor sp.]
MKKFIKFCFVAAMILFIVGGAFYMLGRRDGREEMDELLSEFGGGWVNLDGLTVDNWGLGSSSSRETDTVDSVFFPESYEGYYAIDEASIFSDDYVVWNGDVERQMICQGSVSELKLEIGGSMVEIKDSDDGNVYIKGDNVGRMQAYVEGSVLYVKSVRPANLMDEIKNSKITLYLPEDNASLQLLDVSLGAGQLKLEHLAVQSMTASIGAGKLQMEDMAIGTLELSLGAGELQTDDVTVENLIASIGAGNMDFSGEIFKSAEISCSMGNVSMDLEGKKEDFNYQLNCVAGNMEIDGERFYGAAIDRYIDNGASKTLKLDCSMGNVEVDF